MLCVTWPLETTKAFAIHKCNIDALAEFNLDSANLAAVWFDGASNTSHYGFLNPLKIIFQISSFPNLTYLYKVLATIYACDQLYI